MSYRQRKEEKTEFGTYNMCGEKYKRGKVFSRWYKYLCSDPCHDIELAKVKEQVTITIFNTSAMVVDIPMRYLGMLLKKYKNKKHKK